VPQISELADTLLLDAPGAPLPLIERELREAAREFCQKTLVWRHLGDAAEFKAGQSVIDPDLPGESELTWVNWLSINQQTVPAIGMGEVPPDLPDTGPVDAYRVDWPEIVLMPTPAEGGTFQAAVIVRPSVDARSLPDALWADWSDGIKSGAIARLTDTPGRKWSNPQVAAYHQQRFAQAMARARNAGDRGGGVRSMRIQSRPMA